MVHLINKLQYTHSPCPFDLHQPFTWPIIRPLLSLPGPRHSSPYNILQICIAAAMAAISILLMQCLLDANCTLVQFVRFARTFLRRRDDGKKLMLRSFHWMDDESSITIGYVQLRTWAID